jgi:hypothetical protein
LLQLRGDICVALDAVAARKCRRFAPGRDVWAATAIGLRAAPPSAFGRFAHRANSRVVSGVLGTCGTEGVILGNSPRAANTRVAPIPFE